MQAGFRGRYRTTRAPFPGAWPFPESGYGKALPVARRGALRQPILPHYPEPPEAVQNKSCLAAGLHPRGMAPGPPVGLKVSHFLPFGKDCPVPGRVGAGGPQGEPRGSDGR